MNDRRNTAVNTELAHHNLPEVDFLEEIADSTAYPRESKLLSAICGTAYRICNDERDLHRDAEALTNRVHAATGRIARRETTSELGEIRIARLQGLRDQLATLANIYHATDEQPHQETVSPDDPEELACGCIENFVRAAGHGPHCYFTGMGPRDYPWIREYSHKAGVPHESTEERVQQARRDNAPLDAFAQEVGLLGDPGAWATVTSITDPKLRARLGLD